MEQPLQCTGCWGGSYMWDSTRMFAMGWSCCLLSVLYGHHYQCLCMSQLQRCFLS